MKFFPCLLTAALLTCFSTIATAEPSGLSALKPDASGKIVDWLFQPGTTVAEGPKATEWEIVKIPFIWTMPNASKKIAMRAGHSPASWVGSKMLDHNDNGWFERTVAIPAAWKGQRVWINFDQVECDAMLWIDDQPPVFIEGPSARVDISKWITPGRNATVRVWVTRWWKDIPKTMDQDPLHKATLFNKESREKKADEIRVQVPAGISGYVYFETRPAAGEITSAFVRTSWREKKLSVDIEGLISPELKGARLRVDVTDPNGHGGKVPIPVEEEVTWQKDGKQTLQLPWQQPHLWELGDGYLYQLNVSLIDASGQVIHALDPIRFGFREVWVEGRNIMMNGHPVHLRQAPVIDIQWPSLLFWKGIGFNALEWHPNPISWFTIRGRRSLIIDPKDNPSMRAIAPDVLDAADEQGMALFMPAPNISSVGNVLLQPEASKAYVRETKLWLEKIKNHPSIIMWLPAMNTGSFTRENPERIGTNATPEDHCPDWYNCVYKLIRKVDPTRLVTCHDGHVGEVDLPNQYLNFMPLQERIEFPSRWARQGDRPWGAIEHGTPFLANSCKWHNVPLFTEFHAIYFGDRAYERETDAYVKLIQRALGRQPKHSFSVLTSQEYAQLGSMTIHDEWERLFTIETNRAWRAFGVAAGWKPWNFDIGMGVPPSLVGRNIKEFFYKELTLDEAKASLATTPAWANATYRSYRETMQPLLTFLGGPVERFTAKDHEFYSGEKFEKSVIVIWDGYQPRKMTADWELNVNGTTVQKGTENFELKPGDIVKRPITLNAPSVATRTGAELLLKVMDSDSGEATQEDKMALTFWPNPGTGRPLKSRWSVYDPIGRSQKWLQALGVRPISIKDRHGLLDTQPTVLVVGREAMGQSLPFNADDIKNGLRVLVLEQKPAAFESVGLRIEDIVSRYTFPRDRKSPILAGLEDEDFIHWRGEPDLLPKTSEGMKRWPLARPPHWGNYGAVASVVVETPHYGAFTPLVEAEFDLAYSPLLEWRHGKGGVIFSTFDFTDRVGMEPAATLLARNLLQSIDKSFATVQNRSVAYVGNDAGWDYVKTLGFSASRVGVEALASLDPATALVVVGPGTWPSLGTVSTGLQALVAKGGQVLVLPQKGAELAAPQAPLHFVTEPVERARVRLQSAPILRGIGPQPLHWRTFVKQDRFTAAGVPKNSELLLDGLLLDIPQGNGQWVFSQLDWQPVTDDSPNLEKVRWNLIKYYRQLLTNLGAQTDGTLANRLLTPEFSAPMVDVPLWKLCHATQKVTTGPNNGCFPALANPMPIELALANHKTGKEANDVVIKDAVVGEGELNQPGLNLGKVGWITFGPRRSDSIVHMNWISSPEIGKICYARSYVYSSRDRMARFAIGADYWMQFKVNGIPYLDHSSTPRTMRTPFVGEFRLNAPLKKGWNLLEVKVASGSSNFGFSCQVSDPGDAQFQAAIYRPANVKEAPKST